MIRDGKAAGWLKLPPEALLPWAEFNGVNFKHVVPGAVVGKGGALLAKEDLSGREGQDGLLPLMKVPRDLILSLETVLEQAKDPQHRQQVLFLKSPYIIHNANICCTSWMTGTGTQNHSLKTTQKASHVPVRPFRIDRQDCDFDI